MIARIRDFLRSESLGITIPVGVVILWATWQLLQSTVTAFIYPIVLDAFEDTSDGDFPRLAFEINGIEFAWGQVLVDVFALALLVVLAYFFLVRTISADGEFEEETRECPECKSSIFADATRCAFCTAVVAPIADSGSDG